MNILLLNKFLFACIQTVVFTSTVFAQDLSDSDLDKARGGKAAKASVENASGSTNAKRQKVYAAKYADWFYRCIDAPAGQAKSKVHCEVVQVAQVKQNDTPVNVLTIAVTRVSSQNKSLKGSHVMTVLTPLNVHLPSEFGMIVDGGKPATFEYRNCNQAGCWVQIPLKKQMLRSLKRGNASSGRIRLMNGQQVNIKFSLRGFTKALTALDSGVLPKS